MLGNDGKLAEDAGQFLVVLFVEAEGDLAFAGLFRRNDMVVIQEHARIVLLGHVEAEDHVFRRHRLAIGPFRFRPQAKTRKGNIVGISDDLRQQAVGGNDLIFRGCHQRVENQGQAGGLFALGKHRVEAVESAVFGELERAALWRCRIDVVVMGKTLRQLRLAYAGKGVAPDEVLCRGGEGLKQETACERDEQAGFPLRQRHRAILLRFDLPQDSGKSGEIQVLSHEHWRAIATTCR